jgi:outer membrane protein
LLALAGGARAEGMLELYRLALKKDPRFAAARFEHEASRKSTNAAAGSLLPSIVANYESTRERQNIISSQTAVISAGSQDFPIENWSLTITQPLFKLGAWERLGQAQAAERQALAQRVAAQHVLMVRVASAYLGVLAAQDSLEFAVAERTAVSQQLQLAKERVARGLATIVNLHDAQARASQTEAQEVEARSTLEDAQQAMREILGQLPRGFMPLREEMPVVPPDPLQVDPWIDTALQQNPGLEAKRQAAEVAAQEVRKQRAGHAPTLNLVGSYNNRDQGGTLFGGGSHVETRDLTLQLRVPIFDGGSINAVTEEAAYRYDKALQEIEAEARAVDRQTRAAHQGVLAAISRVQALQQGTVAQQSALSAKQKSYRAGLLTLLAVLDAERDLNFARRDYAKARYDYVLNRLKLKQANGTLSDADLEAVDRLLK